MARIYVGHLSYRAREDDLDDLFSRYGRIREILVKSGFGFVEYEDARDAEEAVYRCNGKEIRGERIVVELTKRPPRGRDGYRFGSGSGRFGGSFGGGGGGRDRDRFSRDPPRRREDNFPTQTRYRVIVENLSSRVSWQDLKDVMRAAGEVTYADAHRIKPGEGVVCYRRPDDLKRALETLDGKELNGRRIKLIDGTRERSRFRASGSRSRSRSRSRSHSSHHSSRSRSKSSRSKSRSRSATRSRSHTASPAKNGKVAKKSASREGSAADPRRSRSHTPAENGHTSEAEE